MSHQVIESDLFSTWLPPLFARVRPALMATLPVKWNAPPAPSKLPFPVL